MSETDKIVAAISKYYPDVQAVYLFGSYGTDDYRPGSDLDVAVLLPVHVAKQVDFWEWADISNELAGIVGVPKVDLINLRRVSTVFRKEIIMAERRIYCTDEYAADEFEMLTLSFYQKLNEERHDVLKSFFETKRAYNV